MTSNLLLPLHIEGPPFPVSGKHRKVCWPLLFLFMLLLSADAGAQTGKNFWFAAPDLSVASNGGGTFLDRPIFLRVTTLKKAATVTISEPANPSFTPIVQTIAANSIYSFNLTTLLSQIENSGADVTTNQGLLITSTENILAYYENSAQYNPDIFSLKEKKCPWKGFYHYLTEEMGFIQQ